MLSCLDLLFLQEQDVLELHSGSQYCFAGIIPVASRDRVLQFMRSDDGVLLVVYYCRVNTRHRHLNDCDSAVNV